jgi:8-oxo-dGTP pyrophosphatase MutT (NUDIX family)
MQTDPLLFQYCPKQIVFSADKKSVLLARRAGEADYNGVYSFIGGKTETTDGGLLAGLRREKNEEVGEQARLRICYAMSCYQTWFTKANGASMILPHHIAIYQGGDIVLSNEYSEYKWVPIEEIDHYNRVPTVPPAVHAALCYLPMLTDKDFVEI